MIRVAYIPKGYLFYGNFVLIISDLQAETATNKNSLSV